MISENRTQESGFGFGWVGRMEGQEADDGFIVDIDVWTPEKIFPGGVHDVGEDVVSSQKVKRSAPFRTSMGGRR